MTEEHNSNPIYSQLSNLSFLQGLDDSFLQTLIDESSERTVSPGEIILQEGAYGREIYLILEGQVEISKGQGESKTMIAIRGPGEVLGDMGFIDALPRSATVQAIKPVRLLEISPEIMQQLLSEKPELLYRTLQTLCSRLRDTYQYIITNLHQANQELTRAYGEIKKAQSQLAEKENLEHELELARELQQGVLPDDLPRLMGFSFAAVSKPAHMVGGDFYDIFHIDPNNIGVLIADVSDKGLPAALFMCLTRSLIRAEAQRFFSPVTVLNRVNHLLLEISRSDMFVTVFYGVLSTDGQLAYARAGHAPPLWLKVAESQVHFLSPHGAAMGLFTQLELEERTLQMNPGDKLILYTDGVSNAISPSGEFFGIKRLVDVVQSTEAKDASLLNQHILTQVALFQSGAGQFDDLALLVISADPPPS